MVGAQPTMEIVAKENFVTIMDHEEGNRTEKLVEDPMDIPRRIMEGWTPQLIEELPDAFCGKGIGSIIHLVVLQDHTYYDSNLTFLSWSHGII